MDGGNVRRRQTGQVLRDSDEGMEDLPPGVQSYSSGIDQSQIGFFTVSNVTLIFLTALGITVLILFLLPSPIQPEAFSLPDPPEFTGVLAPNKKLQRAKRLLEGQIFGPESLDFHNGAIYTGTLDGQVVKVVGDKIQTVATFGTPPCGKYEDEPTCGRPLGVRMTEDGTLYALDAYLGLHKVNTKTGDVTTLISSNFVIDNKPFKFLNDLAVQDDGIIYFTDSSYKWERRNNRYLIAEGGDCGRLMWYNPTTRQVKVLLDNLYFPNGVELSAKQDFLLISETTRARILKYYLKGPQTGKVEVFADNLPGLPDNIRSSSGGGYWVGLATIRNPTFSLYDIMASKPWIRSLLLKVFDQETLVKLSPKYGMLVELDEDGVITQSLHDPTGEVVPSVSEVLEPTAGQLYLGSYHSPFIAKLDLYGSDYTPPSTTGKDTKSTHS
ncbi:adipocyte plasma membrane-associated protein-like [Glandiceps talaboti]